MGILNKKQKVSESPTLPGANKSKSTFDIADLYTGPVSGEELQTASSGQYGLDEKLRQAYFWIVNNAIISPFYDIEYNKGANQTYAIGDSKSRVTFPSDQSYSSFVLLPLLTLVTMRKCLIIGGPGRGKTASALLMGLIAGHKLKEIKQAIQHGQPQMTISDLLGNPIPSNLMRAKSMNGIKISWRKWLTMRVKIIDEYNRIPTRTQSALLTVMGDNYAEILDHILELPEAAWYLTANDDAGGGTYQVIEALKDRIDIVVKALHFNSRFIGELLSRIEQGFKPEECVPEKIIFTEEEINQINKEILEVTLPKEILRRIEFFSSHFELYESASEQLEYKTKDNVKISGIEFRSIANAETGKDKLKDIGNQTRNGLSVRSIMTCLIFVKALSYFRGKKIVEMDDVRHILPFVLHDKLVQNPDSPFFEQPGNTVYRVDRVSWIRKLFDLSCAEYDRLDLDKQDPLEALEMKFDQGLGLEGVTEKEVNEELAKIARIMEDWSKNRKLYGHVFDDVLKLKYLHQRYSNHLQWLQNK